VDLQDVLSNTTRMSLFNSGLEDLLLPLSESRNCFKQRVANAVIINHLSNLLSVSLTLSSIKLDAFLHACIILEIISEPAGSRFKTATLHLNAKKNPLSYDSPSLLFKHAGKKAHL
jgi:hypothetical protein